MTENPAAKDRAHPGLVTRHIRPHPMACEYMLPALGQAASVTLLELIK